MLRLFLPLLVALSMIISSETIEKETFHTDTVNAVLGDVSFTERFGSTPDDLTPEKTRIKTHLGYVVDILKKADTSSLTNSQKENRTTLIGLLEDYKKAGIFPENHHFENRRPVFIDEAGNLCAVGYLIAQTEGLEAAKKINREHKFDYIKDIDPKLIDGWLAENGITKKEAAMIQPAYRSKMTVNENNIETEYAIGSSLLAGTQLGALSYSLLLDNSPNKIKRISVFNTALGLTSIALGIANLDNSRTEKLGDLNPEICNLSCSFKIIYTNKTRTHLSIANIVVGGLSATFNGFRFFRATKQQNSSNLTLNATHVYDPNSNTVAPGISMSLKF